jgi:AbrB family looped-hinge helix DNA binding protein
MATATILEDGKVEIPKPILEKLGVEEGDKVDLSFNGGGELVVRKANGDIRELRGIFKRPGQRRVSIEEMNEGIGDAIAEKYVRVLRQSKKRP